MNNTNLGINVEFFISFICQTGYASSAMNDALENHASSPGDPNKEREGEEKDFLQAVIFVVLFPLFTLLLSPSLPPRHSGLKNPTASLAYEMPPRRSQTDGKNERGKKVLLICLLTTQEKFTRCAKTRVGGGDIKTCSSSCFPPRFSIRGVSLMFFPQALAEEGERGNSEPAAAASLLLQGGVRRNRPGEEGDGGKVRYSSICS